MGKILGFAGKKQSGKNTACNFLFGSILSNLELISDFHISESGELVVPYPPTDNDEQGYYGIFDPLSRNTDIQVWLQDNIFPYVKIYSFADKLKEFAISVLGLEDKQCYGNNEEKNTIVSHLLWENMPTNPDNRKGPMTARETLQYFGTGIARKMFPNCWVNATIKQIQMDDPMLALICDCRFPNEIAAIKNAGGRVIRLTRDKHQLDEHVSEIALGPGQYDWSNFDAIIDNQDMSIVDQSLAIQKTLEEWGWLEPNV